jgi:hypothetical protein
MTTPTSVVALLVIMMAVYYVHACIPGEGMSMPTVDFDGYVNVCVYPPVPLDASMDTASTCCVECAPVI